MIDVLQLPETCSCCQAPAASTGSGDCTGCVILGESAPEGLVTADKGTFYRRSGGGFYELYLKDSGDGTPFGWTLQYQTAAP
jgi:hypothetical protein